MQDRYPMTKLGAQTMQSELDKLKNIERPKVIEAISTAREYGDLKENAEYHAAREEQGLMEARIKDLEYKLSLAQVIDIDNIPHNGRVVFGTTVKLEDLDTEQKLTYKIVGQDEANISKGLLAYNTPIARALIGNSKEDVIEIETPSKTITYEILDVLYQ